MICNGLKASNSLLAPTGFSAVSHFLIPVLFLQSKDSKVTWDGIASAHTPLYP
jgi:hypothetical protein